jgi:hypothetical protein
MSRAPRSPADQLVAKLRKDMADLATQARGAKLTRMGEGNLIRKSSAPPRASMLYLPNLTM